MQSYFEMLGLAPQFDISLKTLEDAYFTAQRTCHPDRFVGRPEMERIAAISRSQLINDAYDTLKSPLFRAEHLLKLKDIEPLSDRKPVPPEILAEMMELRERLFDCGEVGSELRLVIDDIRARHGETLKALSAAFAAGDLARATQETIRLQYLGKAMEEAHTLIYRLQADHG